MSGTKASRPGSLRSDQEERLLVAATEVFLNKGFSGTSIDEIAAAAKASKITFYNHFGNKEQLFEAVVVRLNERIDAGFAAAFEGEISVEKGLMSFAREMLTVLYSREAVKLLRVLHSESERFPHLGQVFDEVGPERGRMVLARFILKNMENGKLRKAEPGLAAEQFMHLALGELLRRSLLGLDIPNKRQIHKRLESAVDVFRRAYSL